MSTFRPRALGAHALCAALLGAWLAGLAACGNGVNGFSGSVGDTPPTTPQVSYTVLGTVGTPFTMLVTDTQQSWQINGQVPLNIAIENDNPPVRLIATKTVNNSNLLSLEITVGFAVEELASTSAPFGTVSLASEGSSNDNIAPPAFPDLRIFVSGPLGERFYGLVEDSTTGFQVSSRPPVVFLFEHPDGTVTGTFNQLLNLGPFSVLMTLNGEGVASASGGPSITITEP